MQDRGEAMTTSLLLTLTETSTLLTLSLADAMEALKLAPAGVVVRLGDKTRVNRERLLAWLNDGAAADPSLAPRAES
jgi:hypothetical protein